MKLETGDRVTLPGRSGVYRVEENKGTDGIIIRRLVPVEPTYSELSREINQHLRKLCDEILRAMKIPELISLIRRVFTKV